ncbi:MAG: hypothetical protein V2I51_15745, partial [Anderseniella sp.]|jgi:hypothetical protein|nr:hypothetical protein [Anderseniella sp.]
MNTTARYVSITGLRLNHWRHWPRFAWHASRSMKQARASEGCLSAQARNIGGMFYTVSLWENERAMRRFLYQGAHGKAARDFDNFATGLTAGYEAAAAPSWDEVPGVLQQRGR